MKKKEYIGEKVIGFKFKSCNTISYRNNMNKHIGEIGVISDFAEDKYYVQFSTDGWWYPAREIEEQLAGPIVIEPELTLEETLKQIKNLIP